MHLGEHPVKAVSLLAQLSPLLYAWNLSGVLSEPRGSEWECRSDVLKLQVIKADVGAFVELLELHVGVG